MSDIAIITDSVSCITDEQVKKYKIKVIPVTIFIDDTAYRDGLDISPAQAYKFLQKDPESWRSSAASPDDYLEAFREASKYAQHILVVTLSSQLSGFYNSAKAASKLAEEELPRITIKVLDSEKAAAAEGFVALAAAQAAEDGKNFKEVVKIARDVKSRVKFIAVLDTVRHVYRTGRIPEIASQVGSRLSVKPILISSNGGIHFAGITRTKRDGIKRMIKTMNDDIGNSRQVHVAVMHADRPQEAKRLKDRISKEFDCAELFITDFTPVMGYATGRGTLALAYY